MQVPYLDLTSINNRQGRSVGDPVQSHRVCSDTEITDYCCLYPLEVNFQLDLKWFFVLTPVVVKVNYCFGPCHTAFAQVNPHTHLVGQTSDPGAGRYIGPCCNPISTSDVNIMYMSNDSTEIMLQTIHGLVAVMCGCT